jgi:hypothetical protein
MKSQAPITHAPTSINDFINVIASNSVILKNT